VFGLAAALAYAASKAEVGKPAPDFALKDQTGREVKLSELRGKVVVLEWFNAGCPVTVRHHATTPTMKTTFNKYKEQGVVWLAICSQAGSSTESNAKAAQKLSVVTPILDDSAGTVGRAYGARTTPHMFIIDRNGVLAYAGAIDDDPQGNKANATNYVAKALDELLSGTTVTTSQTKPYGCGISYAN
jgi:peroxiredoxin